MITKEVVNNEEKFAISVCGAYACPQCDNNRTLGCSTAVCGPQPRADGRSVYFVPLTDVKTSLAFTIQENK